MNNRLAKLAYRCYGIARRQPVLRCLKELERRQWLSRAQLEELLWESLKALLDHAYRNVPFYRRRFDEAGLSPQDVKDGSDLTRLKPLSKENINTSLDELIASRGPKRFDSLVTSGSTGRPMTVHKSRRATAYSRATIYRGHRWFGVDVSEREVRVWGQSVGKRSRLIEEAKDMLMNRRRLSAYALDEPSMMGFIGLIERFKPSYLFGYPTLINEFAEFLLDRGIDGSRFGFKIVKATSETLHAHFRENIKNAFRCPVVNEYGCTEAQIMAFECPQGGLHVPIECTYLEIIEEKDAIGLNGAGKVLVTDLHNYVMPIIRYDVGDVASWKQGECTCGRKLPMLETIHGRSSDFIETTDGRKIHTILFYYTFCELESKGCEVKCFQVVRESERSINLKVVKGSEFSEQEFLATFDGLRRIIGRDFEVLYEYVDDIPRADSGKFRDFCCKWQPESRDD